MSSTKGTGSPLVKGMERRSSKSNTIQEKLMMKIEHEDTNYGFELSEKNLDKKNNQMEVKGIFSFITESDKKWLIYLSIVACIVRLAFIDHPSVVIFDEVHFGGFAQKYLTRQFFSDLHPPLARLLVTLSAYVGGFDGKFSFYNIGADYSKPGVPYVVMRLFTGLCGSLVVPIAFLTMRAMSLSSVTCLAFSAMLIFENALATQSRYILLDSYLVLFTTMVAMFWILFQKQKSKPFTIEWYSALVGLGISIALAASCKWVGLFAVVAVGLYTIADLWSILGDTKVPIATVGKHFIARAVALIALPIVIYASTFYIHFALLRDYTASAASYSLEFQQTLEGGELPPTMPNVYYGSTVRLRQYRTDGSFLHSHAHNYPAGSKQQQVTGYHHRDQNNLWIIRRPFIVNHTYAEENSEADEIAELFQLYHNSDLRLEHIVTGRFLHSHGVEPPISNKDKQFEVSAYGHHISKSSDLNDNWKIVIVDDAGNPITEESDEESSSASTDVEAEVKKFPILAVGTKFKLVHKNVKCALHCRGKSLPEWGYKQGEMTCGRETLKVNQIWIVESNEHPAVDASSIEKVSFPKKGFFGKFVEINKKMWDSNAGLSSEHPFGSRPQSWPLLSRGIGFWNGNHVPKTFKQHEAKKSKGKDSDDDSSGENSSFEDSSDDSVVPVEEEEKQERERLATLYKEKFKGQQVHLIGNPILWWATTGSLALYVGIVIFYRICKRRDFSIAKKMEESPLGGQLTFSSLAGFLFVQWLWHFIPFFGMNRQLFLHHYLPALYFAFLLLAWLTDSLLNILSKALSLSEKNTDRLRMVILGGATLASMIVFFKFAPLGYGLRMSKRQCESLKWLRRWDFDCNSLVDSVSSAIITSAAEAAVVAAAGAEL